jgi:predicted HD superfamily hydrolase involved in NAD metabolism
MSEHEIREQEIVQRVRDELTPHRFRHVEGVVETAESLAKQFGEDVGRIRLAAWLHDFAREWSVQELQKWISPGTLPEGFEWIPQILHGPVVADHLQEWFGIEDIEIEQAIRYHTTGRPGMSRFEKIICLADAIEPGRDYPGVEECRVLAKSDLDHALAFQFDGTIRFLLDRKKAILPLTVAARNDFWKHTKDMR